MTRLINYDTRNHVLRHVLLSIVYLQVFNFLGSANNVCTKPECQNLGDLYNDIIDQRGKPCNNFYEYVCHGWSKVYPKPQDMEFWADHEILKQGALFKLRNILENKRVRGPQNEENVKSLYGACMSQPYLKKGQAADVKKVMQRVGNWPMFLPDNILTAQNVTWQYSEEKYINIAGESSLFDHLLIYNKDNSSEIIPFLMAPISPYGMLKRKYDWLNKNERKHYKAFLTKIVQAVAPLDPKNHKQTIDKDLDDVIAFRDDIRTTVNENMLNVNETMEIDQWQRRYNYYSARNNTAKIDWLKMIRSMYKEAKDYYGNTIDNKYLVQIQTPYFAKLGELLKHTSNRVIGNHVHLYFAERHLILNQDMETELENCITHLVDRFRTVRYEPKRWQTCVTRAQVDNTLGRMYVDAHFPRADKLSVIGMVVDAIAIMKKQISESSWLDPQLVQLWRNKVSRITAEIGYPFWFHSNDSDIPRTIRDVDPTGIDVHFIPDINQIGISAAYLQWPLYDNNFPIVIRYGSLLPSIGHELYHILTFNEPVQNGLYGLNAIQMAKMQSKFKEQIQCFADQYNNYRMKLIKKAKINSAFEFPSTVNEDIPDVMGLKLAYRGYKDRVSSRKENCTVLPGFENFSCEQLFFIAYAKKYCASFSPAVEERLLKYDTHSLPEVRVNLAVGNMKEFSEAYNCKRGDALAIQKPCDIWHN